MTDSRSRPTPGVAGFIYAIYTWFVFVVLVLAAIVCVLLVPGLEKLPSGDCVVVANHASYLDGIIVQGYLPPRFSYVIKGEMQNFPLVGLMLRRIGSKFVERFEASGSARDARQLLRAASAGESLAFFPEGTFIEEPGLGRFRPGAFAAAIKAGVPVVPVVISGSRHILPAEIFMPRHGHLRLDILNPIEPAHAAFASSKALAQLARQRILEVLEEPDLLEREDEPGST